jgi:putative oxidoreductase
MEGLVLLGRSFYALIFLMAAPNHFTKQTVAYASAQGTPLASIGVPLTGVIALLGGLSILLGYRVKIGVSAITLKTRKSGSAMGTLIRAEFGHEIPGNRC